jgi:hypothetical protein
MFRGPINAEFALANSATGTRFAGNPVDPAWRLDPADFPAIPYPRAS